MPPLSFRKGLWNCLSPSLEELRCGEEDEQGCQWLRVGSGEAGRLPPPPHRWRRWQGRSEMLGHHPRQAESSGITCCLVWPPMEVLGFMSRDLSPSALGLTGASLVTRPHWLSRGDTEAFTRLGPLDFCLCKNQGRARPEGGDSQFPATCCHAGGRHQLLGPLCHVAHTGQGATSLLQRGVPAVMQ